MKRGESMADFFAKYSTEREFNDFQLTDYGVQNCTSGHSFGPNIRDYHLIHFVTKGTGKFCINKKEYLIKKDELFYIPPGVVTFYQADTENPWSYTWIGIRGVALPKYLSGIDLSAEKPVLKYSQSLFETLIDIIDTAEKYGFNSLRTTGLLYIFTDKLIQCAEPKETYKTNQQIYAEAAVKYIHENIYNGVGVNEVAEKLGIDRSYFCNVFKKFFAQTPQEYIIALKMDKAKLFLMDENNEIKHISSALGYDNPTVFSHAFKNSTGMSPREWRNQNLL